MKSISGKALCKIVEQHGWTLRRVTGSHHIYAKAGISIIQFPFMAIGIYLLALIKGLLKDADLTEENLG